jgi:nucleotide-binding universal stress UspA family protein
MEVAESREVTIAQAVGHWYDQVYLPLVETIRKFKLLADFPGRTEADLYIWIIDHAYYMSQETGQELSPRDVARDFVNRFGRRPKQLWNRLRARLFNVIVPDEVQSGPPAGTWRRERVEPSEAMHLFRDILVTVTGAETGWLALAQAAEIARFEDSTLRGLHIMANDSAEAKAHGQEVLAEFGQRCANLGIRCTASLAVGDVAELIVERSRWVDLVVINQRREHGTWAERPLGTIFQTVASQAARPILAVPGTKVRAIQRVVLAYDGSPKAREALFVLKHMLREWQIQATLLTVDDSSTAQTMLQDACEYLNLPGCPGVDRRFVPGPADEAILKVMRDVDGDLLLMGGYGYQPLLKAVMGSTVDRILRVAWFPVLICR